MNIVIDQGNTFAKIALFDEYILCDVHTYENLNMDIIQEILVQYNPIRGILGSVGEFDREILKFLKTKIDYFIVSNSDMHLPIEVMYKTPETLGIDRLAGVIGAKEKALGKNLLVIDVGTAITYDFLNSSGQYLGGNISPGIKIRFKSLNAYTKRLPLLDKNGDLPDIGYDTNTAIRSGVINGVLYEIDSYIFRYKQQYPDLFVFLTGGDSFYFEGKLKNSIFADNNLVLEGLNRILNYNVEA